MSVVSSALDMGQIRERRENPIGPLRDVTAEWKRKAKERMLAQGTSRAELSRLADVSPAAITVLFRPTTKQSRIKGRIEKALGMVISDSDQAHAIEKDALFRRMLKIRNDIDDDKVIERWLAIGEDLVNSRTNKP